ncbi:MAG: hypothetical protein AAF581_22640 [Planctomycetota bacterium]
MSYLRCCCLLLVLAVVPTLCGCMTAVSFDEPGRFDHRLPVYGGTRLYWQLKDNMFGPLYFDLPLSMVADTALLPVTLPAQWVVDEFPEAQFANRHRSQLVPLVDGDIVDVIRGEHRGKTGRVFACDFAFSPPSYYVQLRDVPENDRIEVPGSWLVLRPESTERSE